MSRTALPNRRQCVTAPTVWRNQVIEVSVGFDPVTGEAREAFADIAQGGQIQHELSDACVLASLAMQCDVPVAVLSDALGYQDVSVDGVVIREPTSPVGAALAAVRFVADGVRNDPGFFAVKP